MIATISAIVMMLATVAALLWGVWTYKRNGEAQLQLLALQMLQHHLDLAVAHPDLASGEEVQAVDARYGWFAARALLTAQTLWTLVGHQPEWVRTINAIVRQHKRYLRSGEFVCDDFNPAFVEHLRVLVPDLKCRHLQSP
jgi:hypothetical protein